jgi:hypothetical protein
VAQRALKIPSAIGLLQTLPVQIKIIRCIPSRLTKLNRNATNEYIIFIADKIHLVIPRRVNNVAYQ